MPHDDRRVGEDVGEATRLRDHPVRSQTLARHEARPSTVMRMRENSSSPVGQQKGNEFCGLLGFPRPTVRSSPHHLSLEPPLDLLGGGEVGEEGSRLKTVHPYASAGVLVGHVLTESVLSRLAHAMGPPQARRLRCDGGDGHDRGLVALLEVGQRQDEGLQEELGIPEQTAAESLSRRAPGDGLVQGREHDRVEEVGYPDQPVQPAHPSRGLLHQHRKLGLVAGVALDGEGPARVLVLHRGPQLVGVAAAVDDASAPLVDQLGGGPPHARGGPHHEDPAADELLGEEQGGGEQGEEEAEHARLEVRRGAPPLD